VLVDDTPGAVGLRAALSSAFEELDAEIARHRSIGTEDPAAWHPIDRSVVFVRPSTSGAFRLWGPAQDPALRFQAHQVFGPERVRWMDAVRAGIDAEPAEPGAPFQALAALANAEALLDGSRPPDTAAEQELLDALPSNAALSEVVALATEDASPGEASQYFARRHDRYGVVVPAAEAHVGSACSDSSAQTTPRYQGFDPGSQAWPCEDPNFFAILWDEVRPRCLARPIAIDAAGAQCRALARYPGSEPCPTELGWLDPLDANGQRTPHVLGSGDEATRVCEIRQLEGAALASCVSRLDCADCEPGWCATEVPELIPNACGAGRYYPPFRFVLGAAQARTAPVTVVCNEAAR